MCIPGPRCIVLTDPCSKMLSTSLLVIHEPGNEQTAESECNALTTTECWSVFISPLFIIHTRYSIRSRLRVMPASTCEAALKQSPLYKVLHK